MEEIPDRIYLQVQDEDGDIPDKVTWCEDRIHDTDVEYVRATLTPTRPLYEESRALLLALEPETENQAREMVGKMSDGALRYLRRGIGKLGLFVRLEQGRRARKNDN